MNTTKHWYVVLNLASGNGNGRRLWPKIKNRLKEKGFQFDFTLIEAYNSIEELVLKAVNEGYTKFISVGGDGTLHSVVNGIFRQKKIETNCIYVGVIPIGTGNDWIKTYSIPTNYNKAISVIKKEQIIHQDIGKIEFLNRTKKNVYFCNLTGIGFDGHVVKSAKNLSGLRSLKYLFAALITFTRFKPFELIVKTNTTFFKKMAFMVLVGIGRYSGGGMQLTKSPDPQDGLFDVSIVSPLTNKDLFYVLRNLFNGRFTKHPKIQSFKTKSLIINTVGDNKQCIQSDGELIFSEAIKLTVLPKTLAFYI